MNQNTFILDKEAVLEDFGDSKKRKAVAIKRLSKTLHYETDTLLSYSIFSKKTIIPELATHFDEANLSKYYLDTRTLFYKMSCTGTTVFHINEKIVLSSMLFEYPDKTEWTSEEVYEYAKKHVKCTLTKINDAMLNSTLFTNNKNGTYSINIHGICSLLQQEQKT